MTRTTHTWTIRMMSLWGRRHRSGEPKDSEERTTSGLSYWQSYASCRRTRCRRPLATSRTFPKLLALLFRSPFQVTWSDGGEGRYIWSPFWSFAQTCAQTNSSVFLEFFWDLVHSEMTLHNVVEATILVSAFSLFEVGLKKCRKNPWGLVMWIRWIMTGPDYNALHTTREKWL